MPFESQNYFQIKFEEFKSQWLKAWGKILESHKMLCFILDLLRKIIFLNVLLDVIMNSEVIFSQGLH